MNPLTERYPELLGEGDDPALTRLVAALDAVCAPHPLPSHRDAAIARTIEEQIKMHGTIVIAPVPGRAGAALRAFRAPRRISWTVLAVAAALPIVLLIALIVARGRAPSATPQPSTHRHVPNGRAVVALMPSRAAARHGTWTVTGAMPHAHAFEATTLLPNGLVLVAGGANSNGFLASAELYNPLTGSWTSTGSMLESRIQLSATLLPGGQVLVAGGGLASAELYNVQTGRWTNTGSLHKPRVYHTATLLPDGRVLVTGGAAGPCSADSTCSNVLASAELYDPRTGVWTPTGSMHQARARHTATLLPNGQVLVAGGYVMDAKVPFANMLTSAEVYNPRTGTWTPTHSMHTAASARGAMLLPNGLVLVEGGNNGFGWIADAELYHPRTGTWTVTGSLHQPRGYQTGQAPALLGNGQVLVLGGTDDLGNALDSAELYNPRKASWTVTGSLHQARAYHPSTLLAGGQVLVAGGSLTNSGMGALSSAELYQP